MRARRHEMAVQLPPKVDLSSKVLPALDQGQLGSCELNAAAKLLEFLYPGFAASRLQMYYDVRTIEGTVGEDSGCQTRDVFQMLQNTGAMPEDAWPYDVSKFTEAPPPWPNRKKIKSFSRLMTAQEVLACLASGFPLVLGFEVPTSFDDPDIAKSGVLRSPQQAEPTIGGHGVLVVGYDLHFRDSAVFKASGIDPALMQDHALLILNSWNGWGYDNTGLFWLSLRYAVDQSTGADLWDGPHIARTDASRNERYRHLWRTDLFLHNYGRRGDNHSIHPIGSPRRVRLRGAGRGDRFAARYRQPGVDIGSSRGDAHLPDGRGRDANSGAFSCSCRRGRQIRPARHCDGASLWCDASPQARLAIHPRGAKALSDLKRPSALRAGLIAAGLIVALICALGGCVIALTGGIDFSK